MRPGTYGVVPLDEFGTTDEGAAAETIFGFGARGITANDIDGVLAAINEFLYGGTTADSVWHPVMAQDPSDSKWYVIVDEDGTAVMAEA